MELTKRHLILGTVGILLATGLLLVPALPAQAGADVFFGLTIGVPFAPYPVYAPVYAYPPGPSVIVATGRHHAYGPPYGRAHGYWKKHWYRPTANTPMTER
ncbi:MAG: hypothetical protein ACREJ6_15705 [Candidatus Methylomirabilis sp.]